MEAVLSYLVVLVALVALSTPLWAWSIKPAEKSETDRLACPTEEDTIPSGQLKIKVEGGRLLLHKDPREGYILLE